MASLPEDYYVTSLQFTRKTFRDIYPAIDATKTPSLSHAGKVVAITGVTRGLGRRGYVQQFAKANPKGMVLIGRSATEIAAVAKEVHEIDPKIQVFEGSGVDMTNAESIKDLWAKIKQSFGHADVLVANAGIFEGGTIADTDPATWWRQMVRLLLSFIFVLHLSLSIFLISHSLVHLNFWPPPPFSPSH